MMFISGEIKALKMNDPHIQYFLKTSTFFRKPKNQKIMTDHPKIVATVLTSKQADQSHRHHIKKHSTVGIYCRSEMKGFAFAVQYALF